jgi:hypothetical protein
VPEASELSRIVRELERHRADLATGPIDELRREVKALRQQFPASWL